MQVDTDTGWLFCDVRDFSAKLKHTAEEVSSVKGKGVVAIPIKYSDGVCRVCESRLTAGSGRGAVHDFAFGKKTQKNVGDDILRRVLQ